MTSTQATALLSAVLLLTSATASCLQQVDTPATEEAKLIAVLESGAEMKAKADACRQLARIATGKAVPVLAALLADEDLSHMARYALEPIRDPAADAALRDALDKLAGRARVGVIGSIGVRRDAAATTALANLLGGAAEASRAAAKALGRIASPGAIGALEDAVSVVPPRSRPAVLEGLFRCADVLLANGRADQARALYDRLRGLPEIPPQVRAAALRGATLVRGREGIPLLLEALRGEDLPLAHAAARTALEMSDPSVPKALAEAEGARRWDPCRRLGAEGRCLGRCVGRGRLL